MRAVTDFFQKIQFVIKSQPSNQFQRKWYENKNRVCFIRRTENFSSSVRLIPQIQKLEFSKVVTSAHTHTHTHTPTHARTHARTHTHTHTRARRYTCSLHYCKNYEFLCTPRYTEISGICTFGLMVPYRLHIVDWRAWLRLSREERQKKIYIIVFICHPVCLLTNF